jgi:hypothetical protein
MRLVFLFRAVTAHAPEKRFLAIAMRGHNKIGCWFKKTDAVKPAVQLANAKRLGDAPSLV